MSRISQHVKCTKKINALTNPLKSLQQLIENANNHRTKCVMLFVRSHLIEIAPRTVNFDKMIKFYKNGHTYVQTAMLIFELLDD